MFKLGHFLTEAAALRRAVWNARGKIVVFLTTVLIAVSIMGSAMYVVENFDQPSEQFTSIPQGTYGAIMTMGGTERHRQAGGGGEEDRTRINLTFPVAHMAIFR